MAGGLYKMETANLTFIHYSNKRRFYDMAQINKGMTIMEIINIDENITGILMQQGMHCVGCMAAHGETLEEACMVHGLDADILEAQINDFLASAAE